MSEHIVTVTTRVEDAGTADESRVVDRVTLACTEPEDADCRNHPTCDCEWWSYNDDKTADESGHERVSGQECLFKSWFENDGAVYIGEDLDDMRDDCVPAVDRSGPVVLAWTGDEWPEWDWAPIFDTKGTP